MDLPRGSASSSSSLKTGASSLNPQQATTATTTNNNNHNNNNNINSNYELQNSVSELFRMFNLCEGRGFSRETTSDRFEHSIGHQSSKPFSLFYDRLVQFDGFVDKYQALKCQNINEVDPFVRLMVRIREDKELFNFLNGFSSSTGCPVAATVPTADNNNPQPQPPQINQSSYNRSRLAKHQAMKQLEMATKEIANDYRTLPTFNPNASNNGVRKSLLPPSNSSSSSKIRSSSTSMMANVLASAATASASALSTNTIPVIMQPNHHPTSMSKQHHQSTSQYQRSLSSKHIPLANNNRNAMNIDHNNSYVDHYIENDVEDAYDEEEYGQMSLPPPQTPGFAISPTPLNIEPSSGVRLRRGHPSTSTSNNRSQNRLSWNAGTGPEYSPNPSSSSNLPTLATPGGAAPVIGGACGASSLVSPSLSTPGNQNTPNNNNNNNKKVPAYLSRDFHPCDWPKENDCYNTLGTVPIAEQEQMLIRDLLYVLIGIEGKYIRLMRTNESSRYKLVLDPTSDHFLSVTTNRILRISYCYSAIITYVESRVYGLVNQSLVAAIQQHLYNYNMLVCHMEEMMMRNDLFLQKMFFMLLPYFSTFSLLRDCATRLYKNKSVGGAVLTLLHEKTKSIQGMDNNALELCLTLTKSACEPYFEILKTWIYYGEIDDPRKEFFIEDTGANGNGCGGGGGNSGQHTVDSHRHPASVDHIESDDEYDDDFGKFNDNYWDLRYRINQSKMPIFLKKHESIIYKTGKYVSIINKVKQLFIKSSKAPLPPHLSGILSFPTTTTANTAVGAGQSLMLGNLLKTGSNVHVHPQSPNPPPSSSLWSEPAGLPSQHHRNNSSYQHPHHQHPESLSHHSFISNSSSSSSGSTAGSSSTPAMIFTPKPEDIQYTFDESTYLSPIMSAYEEASSQLLHILIHESQLVETFNAVKHYLLLSMGDFIVHFMKFASKDLCKRTDSVVQHRLDSMMGMALGIGVCPSDRLFLKDDPHVEFVGKSFLKQIYQIMKPLGVIGGSNVGEASFLNDPSPSSSYLFKCDEEFEDDDDDEEYDVNDINGGIGHGDPSTSAALKSDINLNRSIISSVIESNQILPEPDTVDSMNEIRQRKLYINSGKTKTSGSGLVDSAVSHNVGYPPNKSGSNNKSSLQQHQNQAQIKQKLFCYESLMLKFDVPFPLSLIFTRKSIVCYQLLFRYVFLCRFAEMELEETWKDNILNVELKNNQRLVLNNNGSGAGRGEELPTASELETNTLLVKAFKSIHKKAFALRYKMIAFVRNFHYFYAFEVIDPFFAQFISQITKRGSSLDSVIECHEKFLEHCFSSCFLTSLEITTIIIKIFTLCIELSHALKDSIDADEQSSMMESSCFFNNANLSSENSSNKRYNSGDNLAAATDNQNNQQQTDSGPSSSGSGGGGGIRKSVSSNQINEKLSKICFSNRHFGRNVRTVKEIIEKANQNFDSLVTKLLKKVYSDNCEYHMMYPFVARLDYNDFYRSKIIEN